MPLLNLLFPRRCALCDELGDLSICDECRKDFSVPSDTHLAFPGEDLAYRAALYRYTGRAGQAVRRLKYERATSLAEAMAREIAAHAVSLKVDAAIPVPIHVSRRSSRGFNQAELLAEDLPGVEADWLKRIRRTRPQVQMTPEARRSNLLGAFQASPSVAGKRILLIDDVYTSGATARECAAALRSAGAIEVGVLTFAVG